MKKGVLNDITYIGRKFNNSLRKLDRYWRTNVQGKRYIICPQLKNKKEDYSQGKGSKCFESECFGHIKVECPTFLKRLKKGLTIAWYESDDESEKEIANKFMAFIRKYRY